MISAASTMPPAPQNSSNPARQRIKPRDLWQYTVSYYDRDDLAAHSEYTARRLTTRMTADEIEFLRRSPALVVESTFIDWTTVYY